MQKVLLSVDSLGVAGSDASRARSPLWITLGRRRVRWAGRVMMGSSHPPGGSLMRSSRILIAAVAVGVVLSACTPTPVVRPTPTPTPTFACTPEAGGTPAPCSQAEFEETKAKDALYAEAEAVYRRLFDIRTTLARSGNPPDGAFDPYATGSALTDLNATALDGVRIEGGEIKLAWLRRLPGLTVEGSTVALEACVDMSSGVAKRGGATLGPGNIALERVFFRRVDTTLKANAAQTKEVASC